VVDVGEGYLSYYLLITVQSGVWQNTKGILWQYTLVFCKNFSVLNLLGLFVEYTFGRRLIFSKMREASPTLAISRKFGTRKPFF
jgi:hypothetical protein